MRCKRGWTGARALMALVLILGGSLLLAGCGGDEMKTGTLVEKAPGQDAGEKASQDAMKAMMKGGAAK